MTLLPVAIIFITSALIFYTIGVWAEKIQGQLKKWHIVVFFIGLFFDTTGTLAMERIARANQVAELGFNIHGLTGLLAILLMLVHAIWATIVIKKDDTKLKANFHKFSMLVWLIWLIPFMSGAISKL
ncbi:MAG: HsmA family protein [Acidaminobacteraceae bacterium]